MVSASKIAVARVVLLLWTLSLALPALAQDQVNPKPTPEVKKLLDAAMEMTTYQAAIPKFQVALDAAIRLKDRQGEGDSCFWMGVGYIAIGETEKALVVLAQSATAYQATGDRGSEAAAHTRLGLAYDLLGRTQEGLDRYQKALPLARQVKDRVAEAVILNNICIIYFKFGDNKKALVACEAALPIYQELGDRKSEASTLTNIGRCYSGLGDYRKAIDAYERALPIAREIGEQGVESTALNNLGLVYAGLGENQKALDFYSKALTISRSLKDIKSEATVLNNIGLVLVAVGENQRALEFYSQSLKLYREVADRANEGALLNNIGVAYAALSQHQKALECYELALPISRELGDRNWEATTLNNIGTTLSSLGQGDKAIDAYLKAFPIFRELGNRSMEGTCLGNIALELSIAGAHGKAIEYYEMALPIVREVGNRSVEATILTNMGLAYSNVYKWSKALACYEEALPILRAIDNRGIEATTLNNIGLVYSNMGKDDKALEYYEKALPLFKGVQNRAGEAVALSNIAQLSYDKKRRARAIAFGKQAVNVWQSVRADIKGLAKEMQASYLDQVSNRYRELADWLAEVGRISEAQQVLNLLKDDEYFGFLQQRAGAKTEVVDLTSRETQWIKDYEALGENIAKLAAERDALLKIEASQRTEAQKKRLSELRAEADRAAAAFQAFISQVEDAFNAAGAENERLNDLRGSVALQTALRQLPNRPAALYTLVTGDGVRVILSVPGLTAPRQAKAKVSAADLNKKILAFRQALTDPRLDPRPLGAELYDLLVRPVEKDLKDSGIETLMWSLDGVLRYVPLWALYDREAKKYLIEKYPSSLFTPRTVDRLTMAPRPGTGVQFGVTKGATVDGTTFAALPGVAQELQDVHGIVGGDAPKMDADFTYDAFRDALESSPRVVHIATHFRFKSGDDLGSFLLLGNGKSLSVDQLKKMEDGALSSVDLLVLSACETAMGGKADGSEFEGFALLAQLKGAGAVMATLWPVSDDSTALLMREFYQLRKARPDWTKLQALREAQLKMLRGQLLPRDDKGTRAQAVGQTPQDPNLPAWPKDQPKYAHPYYWAPFVLTGNWK